MQVFRVLCPVCGHRIFDVRSRDDKPPSLVVSVKCRHCKEIIAKDTGDLRKNEHKESKSVKS